MSMHADEESDEVAVPVKRSNNEAHSGSGETGRRAENAAASSRSMVTPTSQVWSPAGVRNN
jgi:hypothetical protein